MYADEQGKVHEGTAPSNGGDDDFSPIQEMGQQLSPEASAWAQSKGIDPLSAVVDPLGTANRFAQTVAEEVPKFAGNVASNALSAIPWWVYALGGAVVIGAVVAVRKGAQVAWDVAPELLPLAGPEGFIAANAMRAAQAGADRRANKGTRAADESTRAAIQQAVAEELAHRSAAAGAPEVRPFSSPESYRRYLAAATPAHGPADPAQAVGWHPVPEEPVLARWEQKGAAAFPLPLEVRKFLERISGPNKPRADRLLEAHDAANVGVLNTFKRVLGAAVNNKISVERAAELFPDRPELHRVLNLAEALRAAGVRTSSGQ